MLLAGCDSSSSNSTAGRGALATKPRSASASAVLQHEDMMGKAPMVYAHSLGATREAAVRALVFVDCKPTVREPYCVAGRRPNKIGLFGGSGGETVEVFLYPQSADVT